MQLGLYEIAAFVLGLFAKAIAGIIVTACLRLVWKVMSTLFIRTEQDVKLFVRMHHEAMEQHKNKSK